MARKDVKTLSSYFGAKLQHNYVHIDRLNDVILTIYTAIISKFKIIILRMYSLETKCHQAMMVRYFEHYVMICEIH